MNRPTPDRFAEFYKAVTGYAPFPWQARLAERVCDSSRGWLGVIDLPTAAGKTGCIDVAVFALACRADRSAPRRIFFVVDRRVIVDQAYRHADDLAGKLVRAESGILREVADALRAISGGDRPLDVYALRGGMYREDAWVRSPLQPTVITSTVDQVGSRLLFRGYGVSDSMAPLHAAMVGNDALILLDEAHCSRPFAETAAAVENLRGPEWAGPDALRTPFAFVQMTATPNVPPENRMGLDAADHDHPVLGKRMNAAKPARLVVAEKAKGKTWDKWGPPLVATLATESQKLIEQWPSVGVIVNRVRTARETAKKLRDDEAKKPEAERARVVLLTGRMRPLDRDAVVKELEPLMSGSEEDPGRTIVVATQCLEVGADLDFHALVTECAPVSALRQRFGRLNRVAARPAAEAVVVVRADQREPAEKDADRDPVYGNALAETWQWLARHAADGVVDFGVNAFEQILKATPEADRTKLDVPSIHAPKLLPAYLDCWVQTAPRPDLDPDPAVFLHGPDKPGMADVQVVFRSDLGDKPEHWAEVVALCPPSSAEALTVRIDVFRRWLSREDELPADLTDVEGGNRDADADPEILARTALLWAGTDESEIVKDVNKDVRPFRTYIVPTTADRCDLLGDFPAADGVPADHAEEAFQQSRDRAVLRFAGSAFDAEEDTPEFHRHLTTAIEQRLGDDPRDWLVRAVKCLKSPRNRTLAKYPDTVGGYVVTGRQRLNQFVPAFADDESSESPKQRQVSLDDHTRGVVDAANRFADGCGLPPAVRDRVVLAARWHDLGKGDPRFQAMLRGCSPRAAAARPPLAKSAAVPTTREEREEARAVHGYPKGGRHGLASAALAAARTDDDLVLHLIAAHHGECRPFAPPLAAGPPADVRPLLRPVRLLGDEFPWPGGNPGDPAVANESVPGRFWRVVRAYGWWGSAYLEAVLRLADQAASRAEQTEGWEATKLGELPPAVVPSSVEPRPWVAVPLPGLIGSNPLAFLAALGTLRTLDRAAANPDRPDWLTAGVRLSWATDADGGSAVLHLARNPGPDELAAELANWVSVDSAGHPGHAIASALATDRLGFSEVLRTIVGGIHPDRREQMDWLAALAVETAPEATSQLLMVRRDYLAGNLRSVIALADASHIRRTLFEVWDYGDPLENRSLHWEPGEDRRHAYQWHQPNGDPTRRTRGGMLGANRLAVEAWPLFVSVASGGEVRTRGFTGTRVASTFWTWPTWAVPSGPDIIASLLGMGLTSTPRRPVDQAGLRARGVLSVYRAQRILVGKTPNLTPASRI